MAMLIVNGVALPDPSEMSWGLMDVSASDAGRTEDTRMHKNRLGQKRKIELGWNNIKPAAASMILQAVNPEYINVTYFDAMSGTMQTREMYVGDRSAPLKWWHGSTGRYYSRLSFNLIER